MEIPIPKPGTVIVGKYRVERALGEGGMAVVLEATHLALGQRVAVKLLRGQASQSQEVVARFLREAQIAAQLPPEHIARVTDVGQTHEGAPYLVMELLVGRDLARELHARGPLPVAEAVDLVLQACEGVAEAHAVGLVHRDLKPANIFLTRKRDGTPVVKVLDFGLSKASAGDKGRHALTQTTSNFGTPQYMSPEQIQSAKHVDARCDQHALAMVLYELVTGSPPYEADTITALAVVIATKAPPRISDMRPDSPRGLDAAIEVALAKKPDARYRDLAAFAAAIAPFGGPAALASATGIANVLAAAAAGAPRAGAGSTVPLPSNDPAVEARIDARLAQSPGVRLTPVAPAPSPQTHAPLTSSGFDLLRRPRRTLVAIGAVSVGVVSVVVVVLLALRAPAVPTSGTVLPAVAEPSATSAPAPSEPTVTATEEPPPAQSSEPESPAPATSASAPPKPSTPPRAPPRRPTRPRKDPGASEIFGGKRK